MQSSLRSAGLRLHALFTWHPWLARCYAASWNALLSFVPEGPLKVHTRNNLIGASWPDVPLGVKRIELCDGLTVRLRPRRGSLALTRAMFRERFAHEPEVFDFLRRREGRYDAIVEIGANVGAYTLLFAKKLVKQDGRARVFAFEPARKPYDELLEHLRLNDVNNVVPLNSAVGPGKGPVDFYENDLDLMKGSLDRRVAGQFPGGGERRVPTTLVGQDKIRSLVADAERILLKIDVNGAEPAVIGELAGLIAEKTPEIVLGVWSGNLEGLEAASASVLSGYRKFRVEAQGLTPRPHFSDAGYCNYFLEPTP